MSGEGRSHVPRPAASGQRHAALQNSTIFAKLGAAGGSETVAFGARGDRTDADFVRDAAALAARLAVPAESRYLVHCIDAYAFAVALTALAVTGKTGVLAPNAQSGTLEELGSDTDAAVLDDAAAAEYRAGHIDPLAPGTAPAESAPALAEPDPERPLLEMFTSGTGARPERIVKRLRHLEAEVAVLEHTFGGRIEVPAEVFSTASPQHLYGLLFRVLWPLLAGRPFQRETLLRPEELIPQLCGRRTAALLAGTPAHLRVLAASPLLGSAASNLRMVFSSGGPLPAQIARVLGNTLGAVPVEILGSTETGGIAHRVQTADNQTESIDAWTPFESVEVEIDAQDGRLIVTSPFTSTGTAVDGTACMRHMTGDRAAWTGDGGFALLGRADRVVKIAEKRISLPELEERLRGHAFVEEAAAGPFDLQSTTRLGVLVVPSRAGRLALAEHGRAHVRGAIADRLAPYYDRVVLPRRWCFVEALPRDAQGKVTMTEISEQLKAGRTDTVTTPVLIEDLGGSRGLVLRRMAVPKDLVYLEGHFARFPLVAGIVQVKWAVAAARELLGDSGERPRLHAVKFKNALLPGREFTLRVELVADAHRIDFSLTDGDRAYSTGRLALDDKEAQP